MKNNARWKLKLAPGGVCRIRCKVGDLSKNIEKVYSFILEASRKGEKIS